MKQKDSIIDAAEVTQNLHHHGTDKDDNPVTVEVIDAGEPGFGAGDWISITRNDQVWSGDIQGGNIQTRIDEDYPIPSQPPEPSPGPSPPGFEVVFAIASLLAVVYLVQRQKRA